MAFDDYRVKLIGPETYRLAGMASIHHDLRLTAALAAQLARRVKNGFGNMLMLEAMQDSALIHYGRCFKQDIRKAFRIPEAWIESLPADLRNAHRQFVSLRDMHIAHSVNSWEISTPVAGVRIDRETGKIDVHQVTVNQSRIVMTGSSSVDNLFRVAKVLADRVEQEMEPEKARLLESAKLIPADELKRRIREDPPDIPGQGDVGKRRAR